MQEIGAADLDIKAGCLEVAHTSVLFSLPLDCSGLFSYVADISAKRTCPKALARLGNLAKTSSEPEFRSCGNVDS